MSWSALAAPRVDGVDTAFVLLKAGKNSLRRQDVPTLASLARVLDFVPKNKPFLQGVEEVPRGVDELVEAWPAGQRMVQDLLVALYPCNDPRQASGTLGGCYGCKSSLLADFGHVYSSVNNPVGFIEGIINSLANWKLYAVGLAHERWDQTLLTADPATTFPFPLRPLETCLAGEVVHTLYCCAHALAWHQHLLTLPNPPRGAAYGARTFWPRVQRGIDTL